MAIAESQPYSINVIGDPTLTAPTAVGITINGADIFVSTDLTGGSLYWIADEAAGVPTPDQVKAGNTAAGTSAAASGASTVVSIGAQGPFRAEPFGQDRIVNYWFYQEIPPESESAVVGASFKTVQEIGKSAPPDTLTSFYNATGAVPDDTEDAETEDIVTPTQRVTGYESEDTRAAARHTASLPKTIRGLIKGRR